MEDTLSAAEIRVLNHLKEGPLSPEEIRERGRFRTVVEVMNAASWLQAKGVVRIDEKVETSYEAGPEALKYIDEGLPERRIMEVMGGRERVLLKELRSSGLDKETVTIGIAALKSLGAKVIAGELIVPPEAEREVRRREAFLQSLRKGEVMDEALLNHFKGRKGLVIRKERVRRTVTLTERGRAIVEKGIEEKDEISQLTSQLIRSGKWREIQFRPYDISAFAPAIYPGRTHPLRDILEEIAEVFVSMGFIEITGDYVQSCLMNMDALFIPQDHPARELQDTFYLSIPCRYEVDRALAETVRTVHESGGRTGSIGWRYRWDPGEAEKVILRTHTTVNTIRYLMEHPEPPTRVFGIGRNFRREKMDATHLPEFYQVDGIVQEKGSSFSMLIGILKEFYRRLGFEDVRVRPAYFPYTEPSMEIEARWQGRWLEMGGSGIFRPEVTEPYGVRYPVLAWGLGLERLAMLRLGLDDIRDLYISDLDWLQRQQIR